MGIKKFAAAVLILLALAAVPFMAMAAVPRIIGDLDGCEPPTRTPGYQMLYGPGGDGCRTLYVLP